MAFTVSFIIYTCAIVAIGLFAARRAKSSDEDFFLAGRSLGPWVASLSASASSMSGWVTLGLVGLAFRSGYQAYWLIPGCAIGFAFNWFVIAGPMQKRAGELGALTVPDFLAMHFGERKPIVRIASVIVIFVAMLMYVAAQFAAAGKSFEASFASVDYFEGVLIGASIVIIYTVLGGFRAACWTDFVQAIIMVGTLFLFPLYLLFDLGGFEYIRSEFAATDASLLRFTPEGGSLAVIGFLLGSGALGINFGYPGQPHVLVRFMAMRSHRETILGGIIGTTWSIFLLWGAVTIGIVIRAMTMDGAEWATDLGNQLADPTVTDAGEAALVISAKNLLHGVMGGMVLAAILAAIASTADSQLVVAASAAASDIYARLFDTQRKTSHPWINRAVVFALGALAVLFVIFDKVGVYNYVVQYGWAMLGAAFGPQIILALFWKRASYAGCVAGVVSGFVISLLWNPLYDSVKPLLWEDPADAVEVYNLVAAFVFAFVLNIIFSVLIPSGRDSAGQTNAQTGAQTNA